MEELRVSGVGPHKITLENDFSYILVKHTIPGLSSNDYAEFKKIKITTKLTTSKMKDEVIIGNRFLTEVAEINCALGKYYYHNVTSKEIHCELMTGVEGNLVLDENSKYEITIEGMNGMAHLDLIFVREDKKATSVLCIDSEIIKKGANKQVNMRKKLLYAFSDTNVNSITERYINGEVLTTSKATLAYLDGIAKQQHPSHFVVTWQNHARFLRGKESPIHRVDFNLSDDLDLIYAQVKSYAYGLA